jgi:hypothetical protein
MIDTPIRFHHVHFFTPSATDTQAWYQNVRRRARQARLVDTADLPA